MGRPTTAIPGGGTAGVTTGPPRPVAAAPFGPVSPGRSVTPSGPTQLRVGGVVYTHHEIPALAVEADPNSAVLRVVPPDPNPAGNPRCNHFQASSRVLSETPSTVTVATFAYTHAPARNPSCFVSLSPEPRSLISLRLTRPLGRRVVLDADSGLYLGTMRAPVTPAALPAGFVAHRAAELVGPAFSTPLTFTRGGATLSVGRQIVSQYVRPSDAAVIGAVHGSPAVGDTGPISVEVAWSSSPGIVDTVSETVSSGHPDLDAPALLAVAQSIP